MRQAEMPTSLELSRMRERLNVIQEQIRRSQLAFVNDITISNISGKNITLSLNIEDKDAHSQNISLQSRINMPNNTMVSHRVSQDANYFGEDYQRNQFTDKRNELLSSAKRTKNTDEEKGYFTNRNDKTQTASLTDRPIGTSSPDKKDKGLEQTYKWGKKSKQIVIQDDDYQSEIEEQPDIKPFLEGNYKKQAITDRKSKEPPLKQSNKKQTFNTIQTTAMDSQNKQSKVQNPNAFKYHQIQQSPQVLSYLHQQYRQYQPQINTPFDNRYQVISPLKKQKEASYNQTDRKISAQLSRLFRSRNEQKSSANKSNNVSQILNDSQTSGLMKKNKLQPKKVVQSKSARKHQASTTKKPIKSPQPAKPVHKADALFMERKIKFLNNSRSKDNSKYFPQKQKRVNRFANPKSQQKISQSLSKRSLSPKIEQITERLYHSRKQSPCIHNRRFNQSQERERFHFLVNQNQFVAKYMSSAEKQELFQKLRADEESVSLWPMKIVNYTYSKLRKSYSEAYSSLIV